MHDFADIIKKTAELYSRTMSEYACKDSDAWRLKEEVNDDIRTPYALDRDRILYSGAYRRYHGKTQVFSFSNLIDEEMTNRNLHTTYVSQIARTIGKFLGLNLELIEAISLGHDLGHAPFGHDGEVALSKVCREYGIGEFHHNIESLHIVDHISRKGRGLNLTFQVRDGIISHDGEVHNQILIPNRNKSEKEIQDYIANSKKGIKSSWMPGTLEGCVVRITDTIAYIGQDIEDAIRLKILNREDLPADCVQFLGNTNSLIIDALVKSVIMNSFEKDEIGFDKKTSYYLAKLKKFNYEHIYTDANVKHTNGVIFRTMRLLFEKYMDDLQTENTKSKIYMHFLNQKNVEYVSSFCDAEKVRDFIATMTDFYYNEEIKDYLVPWKH
ncbi:MAG TPA: HD domain-containing protein [Candidatus Cloacimonadota bacterium]|nr:HD domain-containing protein [Candidatus Cloacimonadota bacterium]HPT72077.1 HD domain-containing protein [Candidatus Cloacimonadota bacterium]